jgi:hypothetical protein
VNIEDSKGNVQLANIFQSFHNYIKDFSKFEIWFNVSDSGNRWWDNRETNEKSWKINVSELHDYNLDIKNPSRVQETQDLSPHELLQSVINAEEEALSLLREMRDFINNEIPNTSELHLKGWQMTSLGVTCSYRYGYIANSHKEQKGIPYLRITDINKNGSLKDERVYVSISDKDIEKYKLLRGDIVIARSGATAGKSFLFDIDEEIVFASYLIRFRPNTEIVRFVRAAAAARMTTGKHPNI